jgi:hypothetical protein
MSADSPTQQAKHQEQLLKQLGYQLCTRNERVVLDGLRVTGEVDSMYGLETATVVDEFFCFLRELGLWEKLDDLKPSDQERQMLPPAPIVLLYFLKALLGIKAMHALPELLFANRGLMRLVGFSGHVLEKGLCQRGEHRRKGEKRSIPLCPDMMRNNLVGITLETVSEFFNETVRALARFGAYGRHLRGHIDASTMVTTEKAKGAGKITQKKTVRTKTGEVREYEVHIYGWKFTTLWDAKSGLPLASGFGKIHQGDREFIFSVIEQAGKNLEGSGSKLCEVVMDGGYLDGADLYELDRQGLTWFIRGWVSLNVVKEALELANTGKGIERERTKTVVRGKGKNARKVELRSRVVGIPSLESFHSYGPADRIPSAANSKTFQAIPVQAVVVREWEGKVPDNPEVYLTNGPVEAPFAVADTYDERSEIENRLHRELKQSYHLEHLLQKSEPGASVHLYLLLSLYALVRTFRVWKREEDKRAVRGRGSTLQSFRKEIERENRGLVIVFDGEFYGIFAYADLMSVLAKMKFREIKPVRTWTELYLKYTGQPP